LPNLRGRVFSCLTSFNKLLNGKMISDGSLRALKQSLI
jgi:hypothetical protein